MIERKRTTNRMAGLLNFLLFSGCLFCGCGSNGNPDVYHVGAHAWSGDSIAIQIYRTSAPSEHSSLPAITVDCRSCNLTHPLMELAFNDSGMTHVFIPEALQLSSARLHLHGSGIDTTFIQTQRPIREAETFFHTSKPLIGRILVARLALLYLDTMLDSVAGSANVGDELNIYGEQSDFYTVQHPNFEKPLILLKHDAVRLE